MGAVDDSIKVNGAPEQAVPTAKRGVGKAFTMTFLVICLVQLLASTTVSVTG